MSLSYESINRLSVALLQAAGIPHENAVAVRYEHQIGEIPYLDVTFLSMVEEIGQLREVRVPFKVDTEATE